MDEFWLETQRDKIQQAFALFDKEKKANINAEDAATALRYLGVYPTEAALKADILPDLQGGDESAPVSFDKFEAKVLNMMASREWEPDTEDVLLQAFKTLDENGTGSIDANYMRELLLSKGSPFNEKELESFMAGARDHGGGNVIYYEDYCSRQWTPSREQGR
ncbi:hypothetical protein JKP88DRAFT_282893 [Tribonema minus]|uniref:EF-hand domain-containing protein n=1 Tax=Tribonema minus TaxID=303371 RepID=A0A836C9D5_9STRA|nr:hypothetical protein JKP88DRAFT_282893 [Tribonema minus]